MYIRGTLSAAGFTLVEMLIVVLILGLLTGVAKAQLGKMFRKAKTSEIKSIIHSTKRAMDHFVSLNGFQIPGITDTTLKRYVQLMNQRYPPERQVDGLPEGDDKYFMIRLGSTNDYWSIFVYEKITGTFIMECGYQYTTRGWKEINPNSEWATLVDPTCPF